MTWMLKGTYIPLHLLNIRIIMMKGIYILKKFVDFSIVVKCEIY